NVVQTEELAPASAVRPPPEEVSPAATQSSGDLASTETSPPGAARNSLIPELRPAQNIQDFTAADHRANLGPLVSERIILKPLITNAEEAAGESIDATELEMTPVQDSETASPLGRRGSLARAGAVIPRQLALGSSLVPGEKKDARGVGNSAAADRR